MTTEPARELSTVEPTRGGIPEGWNWFANGSLKGCGLLRERQWIYAWDDGGSIYLLDLLGNLIAQRRAPRAILGLSGADTGDCLVALSRRGEIWWLDETLEPRLEVACPFEPLSVAVDPHGYYAVASGQGGENVICNNAGRKVSQFETTRPLRHLAFVPSAPLILGAGESGLVTCFDLEGDNLWYSTLFWNVGGMAVDGDGAALLLACFGHGLVRFDCDGVREGTYRYDASPCLVALDFEGSTILTASLELQLTELTYEGAIRAERPLADRPVGMAVDALGRYAILAFGSGELRFLRLPDFFEEGARQPGTGSASQTPSVDAAGVSPAWETRAAGSVEEVSSAVVEVVPGADHIALYTNRRSLRIIGAEGDLFHESEPLSGVGRILCVSERWMAAASDSRILAYDPIANESTLATLSATEISELRLFDEFGDFLLVESCEYVTRFRAPETKVWTRRMEYRVDSAAVARSGAIALTFEDHNLMVYDGEGRVLGKYRARRPEPMHVVALNDGWATTARDARLVRGHEPDGSLLWTVDLPWHPWSIRRLGDFVVVTSVEGSALLLDDAGDELARTREPREGARFFLRRDGQVARIHQSDQTLIVTSVDGRLLWRHSDEHRIQHFVAGAAGVWVFLGRLLTFFPFD